MSPERPLLTTPGNQMYQTILKYTENYTGKITSQSKQRQQSPVAEYRKGGRGRMKVINESDAKFKVAFQQ